MANVTPPNLTKRILIEGQENPKITTVCEFGVLRVEDDKGMFRKAHHRFVEERLTKEQVFDLRRGTMIRLGAQKPTKIGFLSPFEVVNAHQWEGVEPMKLLARKGGHVIDAQPALWDIASADQQSGDRLLIARTHSDRDDVFRMQTRLNMIADYVRTLLAPFRATLDADEVIPVDEIIEAVKDQPPNFGW